MNKADIYKAVSDLINDNYDWISDNRDVAIQYILGINDMARYLADHWQDKPAAESKPKTSPMKIELDIGKVKALRNAGWTIKAIADEMHVSSATIVNRLKEEGDGDE